MRKVNRLFTVIALFVALLVGAAAAYAEGDSCHHNTECTHGVERCLVISTCLVGGHFAFICFAEIGHCCEQSGWGETQYCGEGCDAGGVGCGS